MTINWAPEGLHKAPFIPKEPPYVAHPLLPEDLRQRLKDNRPFGFATDPMASDFIAHYINKDHTDEYYASGISIDPVNGEPFIYAVEYIKSEPFPLYTRESIFVLGQKGMEIDREYHGGPPVCTVKDFRNRLYKHQPDHHRMGPAGGGHPTGKSTRVIAEFAPSFLRTAGTVVSSVCYKQYEEYFRSTLKHGIPTDRGRHHRHGQAGQRS